MELFKDGSSADKGHGPVPHPFTRGPKRLRQMLLALVRGWLPSSIPVAVKLSLSISIMITVGISLLGAVVIHNQTQLLNQQVHAFGMTVVKQMAESAKEAILANDTLLLDVLASNLAADANVVGTVLYSADRKVISSAGQSPFEMNAPYAGHSRPFLDGSLQKLEWHWRQSPRGDLEAVSFISPIRFKDTIVGYALISFGRNIMTQSIRDAVRSVVVATLLLIVLGVVMSYVLGRRLSRPIHHLMNASRAIGNGHYDYRILERRNDEIGFLMNSFNAMAQGLLQKTQVEDAFARYVPPGVAQKILENLEQVELGGKQLVASVMFVDIVDFTAKSEALSPEGVAELLNEFYRDISRAASLFGGTIDKYMGDCAMLVFGIPEDDQEHVFNSIACAVFFQKLVRRSNALRRLENKAPVHFRIGLNTGEMLAGNIGSSERMQFTVVGDSVNLASRLCSVSVTDQIIITEETYNRPGIAGKLIATPHRSIRIRGKSQPVSTYLVHDVHEKYQAGMQQEIENLLNSEDR